MWQAGGQVHLFVCYSILVNLIGILSYLLTIYTLLFLDYLIREEAYL